MSKVASNAGKTSKTEKKKSLPPVSLTGGREGYEEFVTEARAHLKKIGHFFSSLKEKPATPPAQALNSAARLSENAKGVALADLASCAGETKEFLEFISNGEVKGNKTLSEVGCKAVQLMSKQVDLLESALEEDQRLPRMEELPIFVELVRQVTMEQVLDTVEAEIVKDKIATQNAEKVYFKSLKELREIVTPDSALGEELLTKVDELVDVVSNMNQDDDLRKLLAGEFKVHGHRLRQVTVDLHSVAEKLCQVNLNTLEKEMKRYVEGIADAFNKKVLFHFNCPPIQASRSLVASVVSISHQLLINAIAHGIEVPPKREKEKKDPVGRVTLTVKKMKGMLCLEVADDGFGIDHKTLIDCATDKGLAAQGAILGNRAIEEFIFQEQVSSTTSMKGNGLAEVKKSVDRLKGKIYTTSVVGEGTKVRVEIPL